MAFMALPPGPIEGNWVGMLVDLAGLQLLDQQSAPDQVRPRVHLDHLLIHGSTASTLSTLARDAALFPHPMDQHIPLCPAARPPVYTLHRPQVRINRSVELHHPLRLYLVEL